MRLTRFALYDEFAEILGGVSGELPFPPSAMRVPRGKHAGRQTVALPDGYLDHLDDDTAPGAEADDVSDGG